MWDEIQKWDVGHDSGLGCRTGFEIGMQDWDVGHELGVGCGIGMQGSVCLMWGAGFRV